MDNIIIHRPSKAKTTTTDGLTVEHIFPCDMCSEVARHTSPDDGARLCDICWEIEQDVL